MMRRNLAVSILTILFFVLVWGVVIAFSQENQDIYLPIVSKAEPTPTPTETPTPTPTSTPMPTETPPPTTMVELRGLWVTRFDWTNPNNPVPVAQAKIDEIVHNAAHAGFNAIFFQVRGEADAFYQSNWEPWSRRLTGTLGQHPGWDPLAYLVQRAHARGIQVHAYINVYPVWTGCATPPAGTNPLHLYYRLQQAHGTTAGKLNGLQWTSSDQVVCSEYQRGSPASVFLDDHLMNVATDLVTRYNVDGIHLDHIRYAGSNTSCDPVSASSSGVRCFTGPPAGHASYGDWQRAQVNGTVYKFYTRIVPLKPGLWLSAAVWPSYSTGYNSYYQDSKAWVQGGYIDSISPMIYPASFNCPDNSVWNQAYWYNAVADFQASRGGRYIIPGIGAGYCTFNEIEARINMGRQLGTAGHALFSYGALLSNGYFEALRHGPYATPAVPPTIPWRP